MTSKVTGLLILSLLAFIANLQTAPAWAQAAGQPAAGQPRDEAAAQKWLPKVKDALWTKLAACKVDYSDKNGTFSIAVTPEVKALDGTQVSVRGFILPMDGSDRTKHFLVSRNTPVCLYCPPGQPNEVVEVTSPRAVEWNDKAVTVSGKLRLINNEEQALFFKIETAEVKQ
jgi:hypothetical protein